MAIIRQPSLFSIQELYDMEPTQKYEAIISAINMDIIYYEMTRRSRFGAPTKGEKPKAIPKKRGRKSKPERKKWLAEQADQEASKALYERPIKIQFDVALPELRAEVPKDPKWGVKKNSDGKNEFWFGYKGHLAVGTSSQYILQTLFSSGNLNDGKAAIQILKGMDELPLANIRYQTMDADYDYEAIYTQAYQMNQQSVIAYNKRNESEPIGFDKHFAPA